MGKPEHQHSARVFFHPIALAGTDGEKVSTNNTSLTLGGMMEFLGHQNVSGGIDNAHTEKNLSLFFLFIIFFQ